jgi:alkanesulfonate monooxygenase SsuD/methylene tetrahydromethanopterin reductase-like flavin-dependent oxidoreductase (luciferase family)
VTDKLLPDPHFGWFTRVPSRVGASEADSLEEFFQTVEFAESQGYDAVWMGEEHNEPGVFLSGANFTLAAAAAARTTRLKIGMAIVAVPLSHPLRIAESSASVDQISGGRLIFGAGRSGKIDAYVTSNVDYAESRDRQIEGLEVIKKAWTKDIFTHKGRFYDFPEVKIAPKPFQDPHPPIYYAASSPASFEIAGRNGYHIFIMPRGNRDVIKQRVETFHKAWNDAGHAGQGDVVGAFLVHISDTHEQAVAEAKESTVKLWDRQALINAPHPSLDDATNAPRAETLRNQTILNASYEESVESDVIANFGTASEVTEDMQSLRDDLGLSGFQIDVGISNLFSAQEVQEQLQRFAEEVRPQIT